MPGEKTKTPPRKRGVETPAPARESNMGLLPFHKGAVREPAIYYTAMGWLCLVSLVPSLLRTNGARQRRGVRIGDVGLPYEPTVAFSTFSRVRRNASILESNPPISATGDASQWYSTSKSHEIRRISISPRIPGGKIPRFPGKSGLRQLSRH